MTRIRSESERISSSSSETSRIAAALVALLDEPAVHELDRADVEAARRLRGDQHLRVAVDLARERRPSAGCRPRAPPARVCGAAAAHVELADQPPRPLDRAGSGRASRSATSGGLVVVVERDVLGDRELEHEPAPLAVLRDVADARVEALRARSRR